MIEISDHLYRSIASRLREELSTADWFNGPVEFTATPESIPVEPATPEPAIPAAPEPPFHCRLLLTALIYRRTEQMPEGVRRPISDVVPVWWEFSTTSADGSPVPNDFSFSILKPHLIDHD